MGCGCGKKRSASKTVPASKTIAAKPVGKIVSAAPVTPRNAAELRSLTAKATVNKQISALANTAGGMDKNRREMERKRRLMILEKLHRL